MEKFGLFDLIEKFNPTSKPQNDFSQQSATGDNGKQRREVQKQINVPLQYAMNKKTEDFIRKHEELSKQIDVSLSAKKKRGRPSKQTQNKSLPENERTKKRNPSKKGGE